MLKAGKQNRAVTQNLLLRSTEKHFSNANIYGCQDGILSRLQPKIAKGGGNSFFRVQDAIERQGGKPSVANFAIHPDLGPYSVGKNLFCQTFLGNPRASEEEEDFSFLSLQFNLASLQDGERNDLILLVPKNAIMDKYTFGSGEENMSKIRDAFRNLIRPTMITRSIEGEEEGLLPEGKAKKGCFKFLTFPNPCERMNFNSWEEEEEKPFLENAFLFKICQHLLLWKYIERVYPIKEDKTFEKLQISNFNDVIFEMKETTDDGFKMEFKMSTFETNPTVFFSDTSRERATRHRFANIEIVVDHTSAQFFKCRTLYSRRCKKTTEIDHAEMPRCKILTDNFMDFTDVAKFRCEECKTKGKTSLFRI